VNNSDQKPGMGNREWGIGRADFSASAFNDSPFTILDSSAAATAEGRGFSSPAFGFRHPGKRRDPF
jgi:hypothetical protein